MPSAPAWRPAPWDTPWSLWPGPPGQLPAGQGQPGQPGKPRRCWEKRPARRGWAPAPHLWGSPLGCQRPSEQPGTTRCSWGSLASKILGYMCFMGSGLLVMSFCLLLCPMMSSFSHLYVMPSCKPKCGCRISTRSHMSRKQTVLLQQRSLAKAFLQAVNMIIQPKATQNHPRLPFQCRDRQKTGAPCLHGSANSADFS